MIGPGTGVRVYVVSGVTDMRKGINGLASAAEQVLRQNPCSGAVFAFRGRKGDRIKLLYWDQQGFCLYYKVLQRGRFPWPSPADGVVRLTSAQLAMLWEGIDWVRRETGMRQRVEVPYDEDLANHIAPESCGRHREVSFEALTGALIGQLLSDETLHLRSADASNR